MYREVPRLGVTLARLTRLGAGERELTVRDKIITIPNVITVFRAVVTAGALWLLMAGQSSRTVIFGCLCFAALLDGVDGYTARRLNQISRFGVFLDPALDKLLMMATAAIFWLSDLIPGWLAGLLVGRDVAIITIATIAMYGRRPVAVSIAGKLGTLLLFLSLPGYLLSEHTFPGAIFVRGLGICLTAIGLLFYYWSLFDYVRSLARTAP